MNFEKYNELLKISLRNITSRKVRSILTVIAIIIGVTAIITIVLITNGLLNGVTDEFNSMGINNIYVLPKSVNGFKSNQTTRTASSIQLNLTDLKHISHLHGIDSAYAVDFRNAKAEYKNETQYMAVMICNTKKFNDYIKNLNISIKQGISIQNRNSNDIIIGSYVADKLFKNKIKVGNNILINNTNFKVVGIMNTVGDPRDDSAIYMTRDTANNLFGTNNNINSLFTKLSKDADMNTVIGEITRELNKSYPKDSFNIISAKQVLNIFSKVLLILKIVLVSIAGISIIIASVGVMNSIYTSVLERTKDIGIFKSIGAKEKDISFIFVSEAIILSIIGGIIGFILGVIGAKSIEAYAISQSITLLHIVVNSQIIIITLVVSILIGTISGIFPAKKASKKNVVDCLRAI